MLDCACYVQSMTFVFKKKGLHTLEKLCDEHHYLAVAIAETKAAANAPLRLRGYTCVSLPQRSKNAGGVCLFVRADAQYRV